MQQFLNVAEEEARKSSASMVSVNTSVSMHLAQEKAHSHALSCEVDRLRSSLADYEVKFKELADRPRNNGSPQDAADLRDAINQLENESKVANIKADARQGKIVQLEAELKTDRATHKDELRDAKAELDRLTDMMSV